MEHDAATVAAAGDGGVATAACLIGLEGSLPAETSLPIDAGKGGDAGRSGVVALIFAHAFSVAFLVTVVVVAVDVVVVAPRA